MHTPWFLKGSDRLFGMFFLSLLWLCASCNRPVEPRRVFRMPVKRSTGTALIIPPARSTTGTPSPTQPLGVSRTLTPTPTGTTTPTPTITPTPEYLVLRGRVLVRANCRYGPGAPYLYKYGLVPGSNLEVIGRNDLGTWILVQAIGGDNPCWVKASLLELQGDVMAVAPTYIPLPLSPYYPPLSNVYATRAGDEVTVSWNGVTLRAGDETAEAPYLVEAWVCVEGRLMFTPLGVYANSVRLTDEPGCADPSHGRVYLVEKHGYTLWVEIPWPPPN